jgi:putative multiple sugar transport system substrate-binding protein
MTMNKPSRFGLVLLKLFSVLSLVSCRDFSRKLPNDYELARTNSATIIILTPARVRYGPHIIVPPKITEIGVYGDIVFGLVEDSPKNTAQTLSQPGYFILDTQEDSVTLGLSKEDWQERLRKLGVDNPGLQRVDNPGLQLPPAATQTAPTATLRATATLSPTYPPPTPPLVRNKVGVVLPTKDEPRWIADDTRFKDPFKKAGLEVMVLFSQGNTTKEKVNVERLIAQGIQVLVICPVDTSVAAAAEEAHAAGVKVISYDRLIRDTEAVDYYVTFDHIAVGEAQGQYLVEHATGKGNPLYLYAGAANDNNAFLYFEGAWNKLQPRIADGTFVVRNSGEAVKLKDKTTLTRDELGKIIAQVTTDWDPNVAQGLAEANLRAAQKTDKGKVFILAPNDSTARAIADVFRADRDVASYLITGQDAEKASIQYILDGKQAMTVLKDDRTLARAAAAAAVAYLKGQAPEQTTTYDNGKIRVPSKPSVMVTVDKDNVQETVIDTGYWWASDFTGLP